MGRVVILHTGDWHSGLRSGLVMPGQQIQIETDDYETVDIDVPLSDWSKWVWYEAFQPLIAEAQSYAGSDPIVNANTGDIVHGDKWPQYTYTLEESQQVRIAFGAQEFAHQWLPTYAGSLINYGTPVHNFGQERATRKFAEELARWGKPVKCEFWMKIQVGGATVDMVHEGPTSTKTAWNKHATRLYRESAERGEKPPTVILRGHRHDKFAERLYIRWAGYDHEVFCSTCPPLCGPNDYAARYVGRNAMPYVEAGGTLISIEDGRVTDFKTVTAQKDYRVQVLLNPSNSGSHSQGDGMFG